LPAVSATEKASEPAKISANTYARRALYLSLYFLAVQAAPRKISGQRMKTCPWMDNDQKCWKGLARLSSVA
jgi:hypothetical protein